MAWEVVLLAIVVVLGLLAIVTGFGSLVLYLIIKYIEKKEYIQEKNNNDN